MDGLQDVADAVVRIIGAVGILGVISWLVIQLYGERGKAVRANMENIVEAKDTLGKIEREALHRHAKLQGEINDLRTHMSENFVSYTAHRQAYDELKAELNTTRKEVNGKLDKLIDRLIP